MDSSGLKLNEGGAVDGLDDALKKLGDSKPYLIRGQDARPAPAKKPPSPGNPASAVRLTADDIRKMTPQEIADRWFDPAFQKSVAEANKE